MSTIRIGNTLVTYDDKTVSWTAGMAIDGDGAYRAYAPAGSGLPALDYLANAGSSRAWFGIVLNEDGTPVVQGPNDPAPGYYVSPSALCDRTKELADPTRYVPSDLIPYISVPPEIRDLGVRMGDLCRVRHGSQSCVAICADVSPHGKLGEASIACAIALGIPSSPKNGGITSGVTYQIYLHTAATPAWPRALADFVLP